MGEEEGGREEEREEDSIHRPRLVLGRSNATFETSPERS
jgi:hypothetical protein